jgi:hypothetical protein
MIPSKGSGRRNNVQLPREREGRVTWKPALTSNGNWNFSGGVEGVRAETLSEAGHDIRVCHRDIHPFDQVLQIKSLSAAPNI